ncbi:MAG: hypothetical protein RSA10_00410 [Bacilli bacterium]
MEGFLEEIAGLRNYNGQSEMYNRKFFGQYVDLDTLISLLQVSHTYSSIISLLNKRHDKVDNIVLQKLDEELNALIEKIGTIKATQTDLCNNKLDNDNLRKSLYQANEIDFDEVRKLVSLDSRIDTMLVENDSKLEIACNEKKLKNEEHKQFDEKRDALDTNIESYVGRLNELFVELNGKSVDIFNGLNIDTLREQYEQGLVGIIQNTSARKAYVSYVFDILKRENRNVPQVYATAQQFVANAKRENGFDVPELVGRNDKIMLNESITDVAHDGLRQFADIWCRHATDNDKAITTIANGYLSTQTFLDGMYDYITNISTYSQDHSKGGTDYDKLFSFNNQLHAKLAELQAKDSRKFINIVGKITKTPNYYTSIEREPYEFATRIFDNFNHSHEDMRTQTFDTKQTTMPNEKQTEQINPVYESNNITMSKQLTDEQQRMFTANIIATSDSLVQDAGFEINEFGEIIRPQGKSK